MDSETASVVVSKGNIHVYGQSYMCSRRDIVIKTLLGAVSYNCGILYITRISKLMGLCNIIISPVGKFIYMVMEAIHCLSADLAKNH